MNKHAATLLNAILAYVSREGYMQDCADATTPLSLKIAACRYDKDQNL